MHGGKHDPWRALNAITPRDWSENRHRKPRSWKLDFGGSKREKTSESHPIRLDFLPLETIGGGALGLTIAPGKQHYGFTGLWKRDLDIDLDRIRNHYGVDAIVSLMEDFEYDQVKIPGFWDRCAAWDIEVLWHPVQDMTAPKDPGAYKSLVKSVAQRVLEGERFMVHCKGGLGRTGTFAACILVELGLDPNDAIRVVRKTREGTITRACQVAFVRQYHSIPAKLPFDR